MKRAGFTAVELLIVIVIMAILLMLGAVNVRSTQVRGRDNERTIDVQNIALALKENTVNPMTSADTTEYEKATTYPGTTLMAAVIASQQFDTLWPAADPATYYAPGVGSDSNASVVLATNTSLDPNTIMPVPTTQTYIYQPVHIGGTNNKETGLCERNCREFVIFYQLEQDGRVYALWSNAS